MIDLLLPLRSSAHEAETKKKSIDASTTYDKDLMGIPGTIRRIIKVKLSNI